MENKQEMELYIKQLEEENLRLKTSNKSLRTNNKGLLNGHNKLQRDLYRVRNERNELQNKQFTDEELRILFMAIKKLLKGISMELNVTYDKVNYNSLEMLLAQSWAVRQKVYKMLKEEVEQKNDRWMGI